MTEQEQFEADYLAAFPKHGQSALAMYGVGRNVDEYEKQATRIALRVWQQQAARHKAEIAELAAVIEDHKRLVRELDVIWNGVNGAAEQASLCDMVAQIRRDTIKTRGMLATLKAEIRQKYEEKQ